jgi:hypothetical protein
VEVLNRPAYHVRRVLEFGGGAFLCLGRVHVVVQLAERIMKDPQGLLEQPLQPLGEAIRRDFQLVGTELRHGAQGVAGVAWLLRRERVDEKLSQR